MGAAHHLGVVLEFEVILIIAYHAGIASAPRECTLHGGSWIGVLRDLAVASANVLEASVIDSV